MDRGRRTPSVGVPRVRSSRSGGESTRHRQAPIGADVPLGHNDGLIHVGRQTSGRSSMGNISKQVNWSSKSDYPYQQDWPFPGATDISSDIGKLNLVPNSQQAACRSLKQREHLRASGSEFKKENPSFSVQSDPKDEHLTVRRAQRGQSSNAGDETQNISHVDLSSVVSTDYMQNKQCWPDKSLFENGPLQKGTHCGQTFHQKTVGTGTGNSDSLPVVSPFDICPKRTGTPFRLKATLLEKNREKRNEIKHSMEGQNIRILRPGMVLLKSYISCRDQVNIVKTCKELGVGSGGFYQPGYRDGAKLHLKMMCLGKNWDPDTSKYDDHREMDGAKPPVIPNEFHRLVKGAIQDSHSYLEKKLKARNVEDILPSMTPNICIVNFYMNNGRLGLHQDKDESPESLRRGLPVVSFSIGDSAEFLYGDQRDIDKAEKVILESGDVLIFGGKSRHLFHGVTAVHPNTTPKALQEDLNLRPGRLNLTFREY